MVSEKSVINLDNQNVFVRVLGFTKCTCLAKSSSDYVSDQGPGIRCSNSKINISGVCCRNGISQFDVSNCFVSSNGTLEYVSISFSAGWKAGLFCSYTVRTNMKHINLSQVLCDWYGAGFDFPELHGSLYASFCTLLNTSMKVYRKGDAISLQGISEYTTYFNLENIIANGTIAFALFYLHYSSYNFHSIYAAQQDIDWVNNYISYQDTYIAIMTDCWFDLPNVIATGGSNHMASCNVTTGKIPTVALPMSVNFCPFSKRRELLTLKPLSIFQHFTLSMGN